MNDAVEFRHDDARAFVGWRLRHTDCHCSGRQ
jgi:hypothetical protein